MNFTDTFIRRPVLASAISLVILLLGIRAWTMMTVRQYPDITSTLVTVATHYPGADANTVQAFVTTPLQQALASAPGIDYMKGASAAGQSTISIYMQLDFDPNAAVAQILSKINRVQNLLPAGTQQPMVSATVGDATALMWLSFNNPAMSHEQINDYVLRVAQPKVQAVPGVGQADIAPGGNDPSGNAYSLRAWLDPARMAAIGLTARDIAAALQANNFISAVGSTRNADRQVTMTATTSLNDLEQFRELVVKSVADTVIRLKDVANVELGAQNYNESVAHNGLPAVFISIRPTPEANDLDVSRGVRAALDELRPGAPPGMSITVDLDQTKFITASLHEVYTTIGVTLVVVVVVIFSFLGSLRSLLLPVVAMPLSVIGGGIVMLILGFSVNLLTLLAVVLAIGLVVDDAIIVLENIQRLIDEGHPPLQAAILGTRELATPILVMSTTLVAVFIPIGFTSGLTGVLFTEFAFTLVAIVSVSMVVALTLTPMLSSRILRPTPSQGLTHTLDEGFRRLRELYDRSLAVILRARPPVMLAGAAVLVAIPVLFLGSKSELAPTEDQGSILVQGIGPATATLSYIERYDAEILRAFQQFPETGLVWAARGFSSGGGGHNAVFDGDTLKHWDERQRTQMQIMPLIQKELDKITGMQVVAFPRPSLPGSSGGLPVQFVLTSPDDYRTMNGNADRLIGTAMQSGLFAFLRKDLRFDAPRISLAIKRDTAANLGISMSDLGHDLSVLLSGNFVGQFDMQGRSYEVIPQVPDGLRSDVNALGGFYTRTASGQLVPLTTLIDVEHSVEPQFLPQFQQLNSTTIEGTMAPGVTLGEALGYLKAQTEAALPSNYGIDYASESRQFMQQGSTVLVTFALSVLLVYLLLAAQFESFRDPLIVLVAVPMSVFGALVFLYLGFRGATLNIYTEVGLITLIGLITKQSILVVQFANVIQDEEGLDRIAAVAKASSIRLRPILMTTLAMVFGVVPLLFANGAGAVSRFQMGLVIATGLIIGSFISLYVVPVIYSHVARVRRPQPIVIDPPTAAAGTAC